MGAAWPEKPQHLRLTRDCGPGNEPQSVRDAWDAYLLSRAVESDHGDGVSVAGRGVRGLSGVLVLRGVVDGVTVAV